MQLQKDTEPAAHHSDRSRVVWRCPRQRRISSHSPTPQGESAATDFHDGTVVLEGNSDRETGRAPLGVPKTHTDKGQLEAGDIRSRLVPIVPYSDTFLPCIAQTFGETLWRDV